MRGSPQSADVGRNSYHAIDSQRYGNHLMANSLRWQLQAVIGENGKSGGATGGWKPEASGNPELGRPETVEDTHVPEDGRRRGG